MSPLHDQLLSLLYDRYGRSMITVAECATEAGYRVETIYRMQREGRFPPTRGRRISLADYVSWSSGDWQGEDPPTAPESGRANGRTLSAVPPPRPPGRCSDSQRRAYVRELQRQYVA